MFTLKLFNKSILYLVHTKIFSLLVDSGTNCYVVLLSPVLDLEANAMTWNFQANLYLIYALHILDTSMYFVHNWIAARYTGPKF